MRDSLGSHDTSVQKFLVDIALPLPIDQLFTYTVPPELRPSCAIGKRVLVPFGKKQVTGVIVGIPADTAIRGLKPIADILDAVPTFPSEILRLTKWISEYYFTSWGEDSQLPHVHNIVFSFGNVGEPPLPWQPFYQRQLTAFKAKSHTTSRASLLPFATPARIGAMPAAISPTYELTLVLGTFGRLQFILFHLPLLSELPRQSHL